MHSKCTRRAPERACEQTTRVSRTRGEPWRSPRPIHRWPVRPGARSAHGHCAAPVRSPGPASPPLCCLAVTLVLVAAGGAAAAASVWQPPAPLTVTRTFQPPPTPYAARASRVSILRGGRSTGIGMPQRVMCRYAGPLAGRGVVVVDPWEPAHDLRTGERNRPTGRVTRWGAAHRRPAAGARGCPVAACLHWGCSEATSISIRWRAQPRTDTAASARGRRAAGQTPSRPAAGASGGER